MSLHCTRCDPGNAGASRTGSGKILCYDCTGLPSVPNPALPGYCMQAPPDPHFTVTCQVYGLGTASDPVDRCGGCTMSFSP